LFTQPLLEPALFCSEFCEEKELEK